MKEPSGRYPALFYQEGHGGFSDRIRIIYPDGSCEWRHSGDHLWLAPEFKSKPCWSFKIKRRMVSLIKAMNRFDENCGFSKAVFIGEIK